MVKGIFKTLFVRDNKGLTVPKPLTEDISKTEVLNLIQRLDMDQEVKVTFKSSPSWKNIKRYNPSNAYEAVDMLFSNGLNHGLENPEYRGVHSTSYTHSSEKHLIELVLLDRKKVGKKERTEERRKICLEYEVPVKR